MATCGGRFSGGTSLVGAACSFFPERLLVARVQARRNLGGDGECTLWCATDVCQYRTQGR